MCHACIKHKMRNLNPQNQQRLHKKSKQKLKNNIAREKTKMENRKYNKQKSYPCTKSRKTKQNRKNKKVTNLRPLWGKTMNFTWDACQFLTQHLITFLKIIVFVIILKHQQTINSFHQRHMIKIGFTFIK